MPRTRPPHDPHQVSAAPTLPRPGSPPREFDVADLYAGPAAGRRFNNIDVTTALRDLPLPALSLRQHPDGSLSFRVCCDEATVREAGDRLRDLFGGLPLAVERAREGEPWAGKTIQYHGEATPPC